MIDFHAFITSLKETWLRRIIMNSETDNWSILSGINYTPGIRSIYGVYSFCLFRTDVCVSVCLSVNFFSVTDFSETT